MVIRFTFESNLITTANNTALKKICFSHFIVIISLSFLFTSCLDEHQVDVSNIKLNTQLKRFDSAFFETPEAQFKTKLPMLKENYGAMFTNGATDDFWMNQRIDKLQITLYQESKKAISKEIYFNLREGLKHAAYYKLEPLPKSIYTYISRLDFDFPILYADSLLFIATDLYLGPESKYYQGMSDYLKFERSSHFMVRDALEPLVKKEIPIPSESPTLLDDMIQEGKSMYALEKLMPDASMDKLLKYTPKEYEFCMKNERSIWVYFIENNLLFDTSMDVKRRFMFPAPFSKFRTDLDTQSPGQIGMWIGYNIVKAYADNSELDLKNILKETDSRKILKISNYKP